MPPLNPTVRRFRKMIYKVRARYIKEKVGAFCIKLTDGTIKSQRPDGEEMVASMKRAKITEPGVIEWYEMCFCSTPLKHERETQLDFYFTEFTTEPVDDYGKVEGSSLWSYMESKAKTD